MIIYKITNLITNKVYIGQTIRSLELRWKRHKYDNKACIALKRAINKYGHLNFKIEKIDEANNKVDLNLLEIRYIKKYDCLAPKGYNLRVGGNSPTISEETRLKMKKSRKKQNMSFKYKSIIDNNGNIFKNIVDACRFHKKSSASIHYILKGVRTKTKEGVTFSYYKG